ncbi:hypothetical protein BaRGS_00026081 [Batillaria attramentaria]|uniref:Uncharacterized protein n=1 Tax=Batillaria attramentaria TaxID=370345 RepID=A0ABD0K752_9CAEN
MSFKLQPHDLNESSSGVHGLYLSPPLTKGLDTYAPPKTGTKRLALSCKSFDGLLPGLNRLRPFVRNPVEEKPIFRRTPRSPVGEQIAAHR